MLHEQAPGQAENRARFRQPERQKLTAGRLEVQRFLKKSSPSDGHVVWFRHKSILTISIGGRSNPQWPPFFSS